MKKQGFTLIELMVVIVIMGILAAVAVPKLFAQIDKSKASEVGPAAGTYVHMQDAYITDQNAKGDWSHIGYTAPTSKNLQYNEKGDWTATPASSWSPTCEGGSNPSTTWNVTVNEDHTYTASDNCPNLTPNFKNIGASS